MKGEITAAITNLQKSIGTTDTSNLFEMASNSGRSIELLAENMGDIKTKTDELLYRIGVGEHRTLSDTISRAIVSSEERIVNNAKNYAGATHSDMLVIGDKLTNNFEKVSNLVRCKTGKNSDLITGLKEEIEGVMNSAVTVSIPDAIRSAVEEAVAINIPQTLTDSLDGYKNDLNAAITAELNGYVTNSFSETITTAISGSIGGVLGGDPGKDFFANIFVQTNVLNALKYAIAESLGGKDYSSAITDSVTLVLQDQNTMDTISTAISGKIGEMFGTHEEIVTLITNAFNAENVKTAISDSFKSEDGAGATIAGAIVEAMSNNEAVVGDGFAKAIEEAFKSDEVKNALATAIAGTTAGAQP
jgi:tellurite resistance protein